MKRAEMPEILFERLKMIEPYPESVSPVEKMMDKTAFFPGGKGLWLEKESELLPTILVLGHDFSTEKKYIEMINGITRDLDTPTWRNMVKLFAEAEISMEECYFSNVFMGLRKTESITGEFPGFRDNKFVERNLRFLEYQIEIVKPKLIIALGKFAAEIVSRLSESDLNKWRDYKALKTADNGILFNAEFKGHFCTCVALEHPSMRFSNVKRRIYKEYMGNEAEKEMLKDALKI